MTKLQGEKGVSTAIDIQNQEQEEIFFYATKEEQDAVYIEKSERHGEIRRGVDNLLNMFSITKQTKNLFSKIIRQKFI